MNKRPTTNAYSRYPMKRWQHALFRRGFLSPSLACMCLLIPTSALVVISLCSLFVAQPAFAATWPVPTSELSATLGFHQTYTAGAKSYVHSGIDIPASAGMQISSPLAGTVRFTGAVPSGDSRTGGSSSQETMNAVSIEVQDGRVVTLMPFAGIQVEEGQVVPEGAVLGTLAASGDSSTGATHLHLGYKKGSSYLDPMQLFGAASRDVSEEVAAKQTSAASPATAITAEDSAIPEAIGEDVSGVETASVSSSATAEALGAASASGYDSFGIIETGAYEHERRSPHAESFFAPAEQALSGLGAACYGQLVDLMGALSAVSSGVGIPLPILVTSACVLLLVMLTLLLVACIRFLAPHISQYMENQKTVLVRDHGR